MFIELIEMAVGLYLTCGLVFAVPFLWKGVVAIDDGAKETKLGFRIIILPGTILLWPILLRKWIKAKKHHD